MIKSKCLKGGAVASDVRSHAIRQTLSGTPYKLLQAMYPRVHPLHKGVESVPEFIRASYKRLELHGAYLIRKWYEEKRRHLNSATQITVN